MIRMLTARKTNALDVDLVIGEDYLVTDDVDGGVGTYQGLTSCYGKVYRFFIKPSGRWLLAGPKALMEHLQRK